VWRVSAAAILLALVAAACTTDGESSVPSNGTTTVPEPRLTAPATAPPTSTPPTSTPPTATGEPVRYLAPSDAGTTVWPNNFPDPFVLVADDTLHAFSTASGLVNIPHLTGTDVDDWTGPDDALIATADWARGLSTWAPAILATDDRYVLYSAPLVRGTDQHCVSVAVADHPAGPYLDDSAQPFLCPRDLGGAIDPSPFVDTDGTPYLLWKNDGITLRREASIWIQPLRDDGLALAGPAVRLIDTDQTWEFPHVEAPSMTRRPDGTYWLAYSGNWWNQPAYGIGLARCASATGPCTKPFDGPIVASGPGAEGPGGAEFFDHEGLHIAFHAWNGPVGDNAARVLRVATLDLDGNDHVVGAISSE